MQYIILRYEKYAFVLERLDRLRVNDIIIIYK